MTDLILTKARIIAGVWQGELITGRTDNHQPAIEVTHLTHAVEGVLVEEDPDRRGRFMVSVPIPSELLHDGVQTFLISDRETGERLNSFSIVTGQPLEDDLRAEIDLLRSELDMFKRAFRRHCLETM